MKAKQRGFTLIELMITVAIIAILAAVAYPSYASHLRKSARAVAKAQMMELANRQQQYLLANRAYTDDTTKLGYGASGYAVPAEISGKYDFAVTVDNSTAPAYTITFTAKNQQQVDGDLKLTSSGIKVGNWQ